MSVVQLRPREAVDESEQIVLAEMIADATCLPDVLAAGIQPRDFSKETFAAVCGAIFRVRERGDPVDLGTVVVELERGGDLRRVGGIAAIYSLCEQAVSPRNAGTHARIVVEASAGVAPCRRYAGQRPSRSRIQRPRVRPSRRPQSSSGIHRPKQESEVAEPRWPEPIAGEALVRARGRRRALDRTDH